MQIVLEQRFPLGRFHATPWGVNPFDDPYGEWPPSPWRLIRGVAARFYQWQREAPETPPDEAVEPLLSALAGAEYGFVLPPAARRGPTVRQYQPIEFSWVPPGKKDPRERKYRTTLFPDNSWAVPPDEAITWVIEVASPVSDDTLALLGRCLERMTYFGRAESITEIRVVPGAVDGEVSRLRSERSADYSVPVLVAAPDATRAQIEGVTGSKALKGVTVPPGARFMFARRDRPAPLSPRRHEPRQEPMTVVQFALGLAVPPPRDAVVHVTNRFRANVVSALIHLHPEWWNDEARAKQRKADQEQQKKGRAEGKPAKLSWPHVTSNGREKLALLLGKSADGEPLQGNRHTHWAITFNGTGNPSRLVAWRPTPFRSDEVEALRRAANRDVSWAGAGKGADAWRVRLVPLDDTVPPPPGFAGDAHAEWVSVTPFVPPRHWFRRDGSMRSSELPARQLERALRQRGLPAPIDIIAVDADGQVLQEGEDGGAWTSVHRPLKRRRMDSQEDRGAAFSGQKRGFLFRVQFSEPVAGPIMVGHSATFGLGLFAPGPTLR